VEVLFQGFNVQICRAPDGAIVLLDPFGGMRSEFEREQLELMRQSYE
jgi:hypothetical protein